MKILRPWAWCKQKMDKSRLRRFLESLEEQEHRLSLERWAAELRRAWPLAYAAQAPPPAPAAAQVCSTEARVAAYAARQEACLCGQCVLSEDRSRWLRRKCWGYALWHPGDLFRQDDLQGLAVEVRRAMNGSIIEEGVRDA